MLSSIKEKERSRDFFLDALDFPVHIEEEKPLEKSGGIIPAVYEERQILFINIRTNLPHINPNTK
jgi:hypothetical protein